MNVSPSPSVRLYHCANVCLSDHMFISSIDCQSLIDSPLSLSHSLLVSFAGSCPPYEYLKCATLLSLSLYLVSVVFIIHFQCFCLSFSFPHHYPFFTRICLYKLTKFSFSLPSSTFLFQAYCLKTTDTTIYVHIHYNNITGGNANVEIKKLRQKRRRWIVRHTDQVW